MSNQAPRVASPPEAALAVQRAALLGLSAKQRIDAIRAGSWIPYPRANEAMVELQNVVEANSALSGGKSRRQRMTGLTLYGASNNGKTALIDAFLTQLAEAAFDPKCEAKAEPVPSVYVEAPPRPEDGAFLTKILIELGDPRATKGSRDDRWHRILRMLDGRNLKLIVIDEIHNVLAGSARQSEAFLNRLKALGNELRVPIVLVGTENAMRVIETDAQLSSRFPPFELPTWKYDKNFAHLVGLVLGTMPLREQQPLGGATLEQLHALSGGLLGGLVALMRRMAIDAIRSGEEQITAAAIKARAECRPPRSR